MKKLVAILAIIIVLLSVTSGFLFYQISDIQSQISDLQNQNSVLEGQIGELEAQYTNLVRITEFTVTGMGFIGGVAVLSYANVTIQNFGINDVNGLTLSIIHPSEENMSRSMVQVGLIKAGEARNIITYVTWGLGASRTFVATLMLDDIILHEHTTTREK